MTGERPPDDLSTGAIGRHMVRGSAWAVATRWVLRGIGLVSTVVLARVLTPEDFGVAAMGALTIGFVNAFSEFGTQQLLIRERGEGREDADTAWTVQILQGVGLATLLVLVAPFAARYFGDERAVAVIRVLALSALLGGIVNIGLVVAQKELNFVIEFKFRATVRALKFFVTLGLALWLRSYWALVLASVASAAMSVPLSYAMHPYRPRLCFTSMRKYFRFAAAMVPMRIGRYLNERADVMVVGGIAGTAMLGAYNVASGLASMLTNEILLPIGHGLLPGYAKLNNDRARYADAFRYVLAGSAMLIFPVGLGLWVVAPRVVVLVLGEKWVPAIPFVRTLALFYMIAVLLHTMSAQVLIASGHERRSALAVWIRLAFFIPAVVIAGKLWGVEAVAAGAVVSVVLAFPFIVLILTRSIDLSVRDVAAALARPLLASLVMAAVLSVVSPMLDLGIAVNLAVEVAGGAAIYFSALWLLWTLSGRPRGLEHMAIEVAAHRLARSPR